MVALTAAWIARAVRLDWLRVSTDLAGTATALPSWCLIHKRFDLSQADFSQRWCLGNVLAHVSTDAAGLPALCVHVPAVPACCDGAHGGPIDLGFRAFSWPLRFAYYSGGGSGLPAAGSLHLTVLFLPFVGP